jgi:hypothetical protein
MERGFRGEIKHGGYAPTKNESLQRFLRGKTAFRVDTTIHFPLKTTAKGGRGIT